MQCAVSTVYNNNKHQGETQDTFVLRDGVGVNYKRAEKSKKHKKYIEIDKGRIRRG